MCFYIDFWLADRLISAVCDWLNWTRCTLVLPASFIKVNKIHCEGISKNTYHFFHIFWIFPVFLREKDTKSYVVVQRPVLPTAREHKSIPCSSHLRFIITILYDLWVHAKKVYHIVEDETSPLSSFCSLLRSLKTVPNFVAGCLCTAARSLLCYRVPNNNSWRRTTEWTVLATP